MSKIDFDFGFFLENFPEILPYLPMTLFIAGASMSFAIIIGLALALVQTQKVPVLSSLVTAYISFFRALPSVVLLFIAYYGLPQLFPILIPVGAVTVTVACFSFKFAAYLSEIFRAALSSVDLGQREAGLTVGFSIAQIYRRIILPQAFVIALPAMGNVLISLLKDSSVAFFVGVTEMLAAGKMLSAANFRFFETYLAVGLMYWGIVVLYSFAQRKLENKLAAPYKR
ncbi:amino acid ABC transporter permease [Deferribacterales bacterium RsTz2092]|nr:putative amino-acid permease protein YxeN [Deferribacterales bacterium]